MEIALEEIALEEIILNNIKMPPYINLFDILKMSGIVTSPTIKNFVQRSYD